MTARLIRMRPRPCALSIAGLDPSGGAGVFADLRAFAAASVWGCGAVAVVTVQSTAGLRSSHPTGTRLLLREVREILHHQRVRSIKIGALGSVSNARAIASWMTSVADDIPIVLDPVMRPTRTASHARLLAIGAKPILLRMMKRVTLVTPNVPEAEYLLDRKILTLDDAAEAARKFVVLGARAALVKGGHLPARSSSDGVTDILAVGRRLVPFRSQRVKAAFHGTGCALSSLVAGRLALQPVVDDDAIVLAVRWAERRLRRALAEPLRIGDGLAVVNL